MKHLLTGALLACITTTAIAQPSDKIESDRPGESQSAYVVPAKTLQGEFGYEFEKTDDNERNIQHPEAILKYGFFNRLELRVTVPLATQRNEALHINEHGLQPVQVGFKTLLTKGHAALPQTSLTTEVGLPSVASEYFKVDKIFPLVRLNMQNNITDKFSLTYNVAAEWDGEDSKPTWLYTISPQLEIGEKWEVFAEAFSYLHAHEKPSETIDGGLAWYPANDVKWDVSAGVGITSNAPHHFFSTGLSFRLK